MAFKAVFGFDICVEKIKVMKNGNKKLTNILDSEVFGNNGRQYCFDIKKARNNTSFLQITRLDHRGDETFRRTQVIFFEDDLPFFVEAVSMLLSRFSHGETNSVN